MSNAVVIGASRGIGRDLVDQLRAADYDVVATMRKPTDIPGVKVVALDVTTDESVELAAREIQSLDLLIVNAAVGKDDRLLTTSSSDLAWYLESNVIGPHRVVNAFLPALRAGKNKQIILVTSTSGSLEHQAELGFQQGHSKGLTSAVTKAALNMLALQFHNELHTQEGFIVVPLHPGWVATDMGNVAGQGGMPASESVSGIVKFVENLQPEQSGKFFR